jgi:sugar phosphate isomerase/epimerase
MREQTTCKLAITSDYYQSEGDPQPYLKRIAEAGFTHIHWCHHWATDFFYSDHETGQIRQWLEEYGLRLLNLHASHGKEKYWVSPSEYQRLSGIELVKNRIQMAAFLEAKVVIVHIPTTRPRETRPAWLELTRKSLDLLEPFAMRYSMRLAVENMPDDDWEMLETVLGEYHPGYMGLCYDSGHANLNGGDFAHLERLKDRLIAVHLHDNDGASDQHKIPFTGTFDWETLAGVIAASAYRECLNLEVHIRNSGDTDEVGFLQHTYQAGKQLAAMIDGRRMA